MTKTTSEGCQTATEIDIVPLSEVPQEDVLDLLRTSLNSSGVTRKTDDFWKWKHQDNPFGESIGCAAKSCNGGELVAVRPLMRWSFVSPTYSEISALRPVDTVTHPEWRGRGLFSRLTRYSLDRIDGFSSTLVFNTPNDASLPGYEKMGWVRSDRLSLLVRPGDFISIFRSLWAGFFNRSAKMVWSGVKRDGILLATEMSQSLVDEVVDFCVSAELARAPVGLRTVRTKPFLMWRYFRQPNAEYGFSLIRDQNGRIVSVVVLRPEVRGWARAVLLVDVFADPATVVSVRHAVRSAMRRASANVFVAHSASGSVEQAAMRRELFLPLKSKILAARRLGAVDDSRMPLPSTRDLIWDLSLGDIEIF